MKRIGIVGGGQLGRMLTIPAKEMGFLVTVLDPTPNCPASQVGAIQIIGSLTDKKAIKKLAEVSDVVTFEIEHIDVDTLDELSKSGKLIHPSPKTLRTIKDKLAQKKFLQKQKIPTADFLEVNNKDDIVNAAKKFGYPLVLKNRFGGYDGRGNAVIKNEKDIKKAFVQLGEQNLYGEKYIPFVKELAIMVARNTNGNIVTYPVVETIHKNNILRFTLAPAPITKSLQKKANAFAIAIMKHLHGAGVFGIELFLTKSGEILVNEIAPRVHNSGHYTIEACITSQFDQHIRAITKLPLGDTRMVKNASVMVNILGEKEKDATIGGLSQTLAIKDATIHLYGKSKTLPERKMGHITVVGDDIKDCLRLAKKARKAIDV